MALVRLREPTAVRMIEVDGATIEAGQGEPLAMSIAASGRMLLSRSVKYHRPRGAVCYSNRCDGCLMRVDGKQSVPTCQLRVEGHHICETQNVLGSARTDFLAVTDWFFSDGLDHHHMFTRFGPINRIMQKVARRIAGVGTLPDHTPDIEDAQRRDVDVLVVGAGRSGLCLARKLAERGRSVVVVDERTVVPREALCKQVEQLGVTIELGVSALGVYEQLVLAFDGVRCTVFEPRQLVLATGTHEHVPAVRGADHPGVITGQAAHRLLDEGFAPGKQVVLVPRDERDGAQLRRRFERHGVQSTVFALEQIKRIRGGNCVDLIELAEGTRQRADAVVFVGFRSGVYELAVQAGAGARFRDDGFWVEADRFGVAGPRTYAIGSCVDGHVARDENVLAEECVRVASHMIENADVR